MMLFQCSADIEDGLNNPSPAWGFFLSQRGSGESRDIPGTSQGKEIHPVLNTGQIIWDDFYHSRKTWEPLQGFSPGV